MPRQMKKCARPTKEVKLRPASITNIRWRTENKVHPGWHLLAYNTPPIIASAQN